MKHSNHPRGRFKVRTWLGAAILLAGLGAALPAVTASADSESVRNVVQEQVESTGESAGAGAIAGPAIAINNQTIPQINVQVIAGDQETRDNSTQAATNTLNLEQSGAAATGAASADAGSTATTGPATATNLALGYQINVQVIAGIGCDVDQTASNTFDLTQDAAAASGDANATQDGNASSGGASAMNIARVSQRNLQVYVCRGGATGEQVAENVGDFEQTTAAATGTATAEGGSAATGGANATGDLGSTQFNRQIVID